jgi:hypothetical protein
MPLDLSHRHTARIEAQDLVVEPLEPRLALGDELRLEAAGAVAGHRKVEFAVPGQDRLRAGPVAAVSAATTGRITLLIAQVTSQLSPESPFDQGLLELLEQPVIPGQIFGLRIVNK